MGGIEGWMEGKMRNNPGKPFTNYLGSVILNISRASLPMKFTDSSTRGNLGMGIVVDW